MSIIGLLVTLGLIGFAYWAITTAFSPPPPIARIILVVCVVLAVMVALSAFGILPSGGGRVLRLR